MHVVAGTVHDSTESVRKSTVVFPTIISTTTRYSWTLKSTMVPHYADSWIRVPVQTSSIQTLSSHWLNKNLSIQPIYIGHTLMQNLAMKRMASAILWSHATLQSMGFCYHRPSSCSHVLRRSLSDDPLSRNSDFFRNHGGRVTPLRLIHPSSMSTE